MNSIWFNKKIQKIFAKTAKLHIFSIGIKYFIIGSIAETFTESELKDEMWRILCKKLAKEVVKAGGLTLYIDGEIPIDKLQDTPHIFVSNHPTMLDGFVYYSLLAPHIVPVTAPASEFSFPFNVLFKKIGSIDLYRDEYDEIHYKATYSKKDAFKKMMDTINRGKSILIFPEGHTEKLKQLHYIHTGAARLSLRSKAPIVQSGIIGMDHIFVGKGRARKGTVRVKFGDIHTPPKITKTTPYGKLVRPYTNELKEGFISLLPPRYIPSFLQNEPPPHSAAFIDIDRTIYQGYSQVDFLLYFMRKGFFSRLSVYKTLGLFTLEKLGFIPHKVVMDKGLQIIQGISPKELEEMSHEFFENEAKKKLYDDMLTRIKDHQEAGQKIILVSEVITPLAKQFEKYVRANGVCTTTMYVQKGLLTGKIRRLSWREEKAHSVEEYAHKHHVDLQKSFAYGDSYSDKFMLGLVGNPIAVNPSKKLKKLAKKNHWKIL